MWCARACRTNERTCTCPDGMGGRWSRAIPSRVATPAAFPPAPTLPQRVVAAAPLAPEIDRNRALTDMLNKSTILTQNQPTGGAPPAATKAVAAKSGDEAPPEALSSDDLQRMLILHAQQPKQWDARSLARKFGIPSKEQEVALSLKYVIPYRIEEDQWGRLRGVEHDVDSEPVPSERGTASKDDTSKATGGDTLTERIVA